jgi:hypothetical protein
MPKRTASLVITALLFCAYGGPHVQAKTGHHANSQGSSNIDPDAIDAFNKMGAYLRSLKTFQVDSEVTTTTFSMTERSSPTLEPTLYCL